MEIHKHKSYGEIVDDYLAQGGEGIIFTQKELTVAHQQGLFMAAMGKLKRMAQRVKIMEDTQPQELKIYPLYMDAVLDGTKKAEYRKDDRHFQKDELLLLREWVRSPGGEIEVNGERVRIDTDGGTYTGRQALIQITHVCRGAPIPHDHVMLSFKILATVTPSVHD